jgi:hypothetical protein
MAMDRRVLCELVHDGNGAVFNAENCADTAKPDAEPSGNRGFDDVSISDTQYVRPADNRAADSSLPDWSEILDSGH